MLRHGMSVPMYEEGRNADAPPNKTKQNTSPQSFQGEMGDEEKRD